MRSIRFSFRSLALTSVAAAALAAGACSDSTSDKIADPSEVTTMRLRFGNQRADYFFKPSGNGNNVAVLSGIGIPATPLDTIMTVAWLREDGTTIKELTPAHGWRAYIDTIPGRASQLFISPRKFDGYGFNVRANAALPATGFDVDIWLQNPLAELVFGPVRVTIKTP